MTSTERNPIPPQLTDVLDDVLSINASSFRLTREAEHIMVAFSAHNQAGEIDYTMESGEEMMSYLIECGYSPSEKPRIFDLEFENTILKCQISADDLEEPNQVEILFTKEKNPNQQVDPIVTTPVDEVEAQGTQGHP